MSTRNKIRVQRLGANVTTAASASIGVYDISDLKQFDLTIRSSSSTGFKYEVFTSPLNLDALYTSQTGGTFSAGTCATLRHSFINNNMNFLKIVGSATAVVSASHGTVIFSSVEK